MTFWKNLPMFSRALPVLLLATAFALALPCAASAHGLRLSLQAEAEGLRGQALYSDGTPARGEAAALFAAADAGDARPLAQTQTDADGRFRFPLAAAGSYRVVVEGEEGHRSEATADWTPLPRPGEAAGQGADTAAVAAAVRAELAPLREDVARLDARIRLADLVGGVGIVIGLAGGLAWWRARRRA